MADEIAVVDGKAVVEMKEYPMLGEYSSMVKPPERTIVGREREVRQLRAAMERPELCNALLLGPAGSGKTALVQALTEENPERHYREVDLARMIAGLNSSDELGSKLKRIFDEAERYVVHEGTELILFIDEIHQIVQLSPAAVEALKPILADSGTRGIRVIAATTYDEFHEHMSKNLPLVERLQRINLDPPDRNTTLQILRGMAERYGVADQFYDDTIFRMIYDYTENYMPMSAQPRKSILILDAMVGWNKSENRPMNMHLVADVLEDTANVNVAFNVDAVDIKRQIDAKVFSQDFATSVVARRLQIAVADLHDKGRPMSSFLLTGSTGVGKSTTCSTMIPVWTEDGIVAWKKAGDLVSGDHTFTRRGTPQKVLGVFPQGQREVYRVTLGDGRTLDVSDNHLWAVVPAKRSRDEGFTIYSTQTLINKGITTRKRDGREAMKYFIPMNEAVQWPEADLSVDPYVLGAMVGNGQMTSKAGFLISSDDEFTVAKVAELIGAVSYKKSASSYDWAFGTGETYGQNQQKRVQLRDVYASLPEMVGVKSGQKRIPQEYLSASIEQRWDLVKGLFDTDGSIGQSDGDRFNVSYSTTSEGLAEDLVNLLYSLGVSNSVGVSKRERDGRELVEYSVHVKSTNDGKGRFFSLPRKLEIAQRAKGVNKQREKTFDWVGIRSIEKLDQMDEMVCIYVDDDEHLYQAGQFVVTHNTELTKQLAKILFGDDQRHLIRFDMTEFSRESSVTLFQEELAERVWNLPYSVILFDEIEKAAPNVSRLLLGVLDDGRLSNKDGREISFLNSYIILTTNVASEIYKEIGNYSPDDTGSGATMMQNMRVIRRSIKSAAGNRFPPELMGRIDDIVPFSPLSRSTQRTIVENRLWSLAKDVMAKHGVRLKVDSRVLDFLIEDKGETDSDSGGAREAIRRMTNEVTSQVAAFINAHPHEKSIRVDIVGELVFENKERLDSDAYVSVTASA